MAPMSAHWLTPEVAMWPGSATFVRDPPRQINGLPLKSEPWATHKGGSNDPLASDFRAPALPQARYTQPPPDPGSSCVGRCAPYGAAGSSARVVWLSGGSSQHMGTS